MRRSLLAAVSVIAALITAAPAQAAPAPRNHPVLTPGCRRSPALPPGQTVTETMTSGGYQRSYLIHLPVSYRSWQPTPVVLAFHGSKGDGTDIVAFSGIDALPVIGVSPVGFPGEADQPAW